MRDRPGGAELLRQARATLLESLLGALPENKRTDALLIAKAMLIAARELAAGDGAGTALRDDLAGLLGRTPAGEADAALEALNHQLAEEIRGGRRDGDAGLHELLRREVEGRLALSNPARLDDDGDGVRAHATFGS